MHQVRMEPGLRLIDQKPHRGMRHINHADPVFDTASAYGRLDLGRNVDQLRRFTGFNRQLLGHVGLHRRLSSLTAFTSSKRPTDRVWGADRTTSGFSSISFAIFRIASQNRSRSSLDSVSVGSIINASSTIKGKFTVGGETP